MVITNMMGGFGNNLFQIANIIQVSKKLGVQFKTNGIPERGSAGFYNGTDFEFNRIFEEIPGFVDKNLRYNNIYRHHDLYGNTDFTYKKVECTDNTAYEGYFQSEKYFSDVNITNYFIFKTSLINFVINKYSIDRNKKYTSLHCRFGGDRNNQQTQYYHKNVSKDFYFKSLTYLPENTVKFIISDNIQLAKEFFDTKIDNIIYVDDTMESSFALMSICNYNIIGNSTFSWWSSYLNLNDEKMTIAPKTEWFGPGYGGMILDDLFPKKWLCL